MIEDEEFIKPLLELVKMCESKSKNNVKMIIGRYNIEFKFTKDILHVNHPEVKKDQKKSSGINQVGDALTGLGDSITEAFIGGKF